MKLSFENRNRIIGDLTVEDGNSKITVDVVGIGSKIPEETIDNLVYVAFEMASFNRTSEVDFAYDILSKNLSKGDIEDLFALFNPEEES